MAKKMSHGLVALSSAAIVSVYGIGYAVTQPAAVSMAAGVAPSAQPATAAAGDSAPPSSPTATPASPAATAASSPAGSPTASPASNGLKDGTYSATGWSRHGSVTASVTIKNGKIASAPITGVTTRYSQSVIAGLPAKVVSAQGPRVDMVSGATDSSEAYLSAVQQALAQAGGAPASQSSTTAPGTTSASGGSVQVTGPNGVIYQGGGGRHRGGRGGSFGD